MELEIVSGVVKPNLKVMNPIKNELKDLGYYSFKERVFDLSELFKSSVNKEFTNVIKSMTYEGLATGYESKGVRKNHPVFFGVYKLAPFDEYLGEIPLENQKEIKENYKTLLNNPFLQQQFELVILAPLNNFAEENNIKAIDPIVFAYFKEGDHCCEKNYLITLTQWI